MGRQVVGMMHPVWAPMTAHTEGAMPTYGTGILICEARTCTFNKTYANNPDYGDNQIVDDDNSLTGLGITFESTGLEMAARVAMLGEERKGADGEGQWVNSDATPYGGFGFVEEVRDKGVYKYHAWITLAAKFMETNHTANTREENITWGHPQLEGRAKSLVVDNTGKNRWQLHETFDTIAAAKTFVDTMLNYS